MPIMVKGRDIVNMVQGGRNHETFNIGTSSGFTKGDNPTSSWEYPSPFGITIEGRDLSVYYKAQHRDYSNSVNDQHIPEGVNQLKVFCIGGGGGGSGGNGGHKTYNREKGNWVGSNMNRNFRWNQSYWNYYTKEGPPSNGNVGSHGGYGGYNSGVFNRNSNTFNVVIGNGGGGGNGGYYQDGNQGTSGNSGAGGNMTRFNIGSENLDAGGGGGGYGTVNNYSQYPPPFNAPGDRPSFSFSAGFGGNKSTGTGGQGGQGNRGFCRVYFLY
jgi:hypothetical protein